MTSKINKYAVRPSASYSAQKYPNQIKDKKYICYEE